LKGRTVRILVRIQRRGETSPRMYAMNLK